MLTLAMTTTMTRTWICKLLFLRMSTTGAADRWFCGLLGEEAGWIDRWLDHHWHKPSFPSIFNSILICCPCYCCWLWTAKLISSMVGHGQILLVLMYIFVVNRDKCVSNFCLFFFLIFFFVIIIPKSVAKNKFLHNRFVLLNCFFLQYSPMQIHIITTGAFFFFFLFLLEEFFSLHFY